MPKQNAAALSSFGDRSCERTKTTRRRRPRREFCNPAWVPHVPVALGACLRGSRLLKPLGPQLQKAKRGKRGEREREKGPKWARGHLPHSFATKRWKVGTLNVRAFWPVGLQLAQTCLPLFVRKSAGSADRTISPASKKSSRQKMFPSRHTHFMIREKVSTCCMISFCGFGRTRGSPGNQRGTRNPRSTKRTQSQRTMEKVLMTRLWE